MYLLAGYCDAQVAGRLGIPESMKSSEALPRWIGDQINRAKREPTAKEQVYFAHGHYHELSAVAVWLKEKPEGRMREVGVIPFSVPGLAGVKFHASLDGIGYGVV